MTQFKPFLFCVSCTIEHTRLQKRGVALLAVLWMVAAVSLIITGVVQSVRAELRLTSVASQSLQGDAVGQAAIVMVLQSMLMPATPTDLNSFRQLTVNFRGQDITVEVQPLNGLIDLNRASEELLTNTFRIGAGLPPAHAQELAQTIITARTSSATGRSKNMRLFEATEDLLKIPGVSYDVYARLAPLVTAEVSGSGRVNPMAAPAGVLAILSDGNQASVDQFVNQRASGTTGLDTTAFAGNHSDGGAVRRFRLQARVPLADGAVLVSTRSVNLVPSPKEGLPWRIFDSGRGLSTPAQGAS